MAEEQAQEKTLPASPRRLEKARAEGRVPRSAELGTAFALLAALAALGWGGAELVQRLGALLGAGLRIERSTVFDTAALGERFASLALEALMVAAPVFATLILAGIAAPLAVGGWVLSGEALAPRFSRIDPLAGLGRIFSLHGLTELSKALGKALLFGAAAALFIWSHRDAAATLAAVALAPALGATGELLLGLLGALFAAAALVAAIDVPLQIWRYRSQLRMSMQELREETRETEGDPHLRARIRSQQREIARRRMMSEVPKADVVVTNPTHYAVALAYREGTHRAPTVLAKGAGEIAARIREIAARHEVPRLEAPPLARALYRHVEIGEEIPRSLYDAVALVLAWVFQVKRQRVAGGRVPAEPRELPVPAELDFDAGTAR
ncbi:MAG: flagellar biosynthesis protein FlhB [Betaproteobacteria bacterium]|nr:flagellar biosynthesis protein FlhB [Betaproteobacteria bacterium]